MATKWHMKGEILGACSCDWGCPCSFDADPTQGWCEGGYFWHVDEGKFGDTPLAGLKFGWYGKSPGAMYKGDVTWMVAIDEKATADQRRALARLGEGKSGGPWAIFVAVSSKVHPPEFVPLAMELDGINSSATVPGLLELKLGPILNPVTGEAEELYLDKPTGFTATRTTLGASRVFRVNSHMNFDHSGKYGEYSKFDYAGESPD